MITRVLVTGAGGAAAVSFIHSFREGEVTFFAGDMDHYGAGLYLVPAGRRLSLLPGDDPRFVDQLQEICARHGIDVLVPTVDVELLPISLRRVSFAALGTRVLVAPPAALRTCLDKARLIDACASVCPVPRSAILDERFSAAGWPFPLLVKPRSGAGGRGVHVVAGERELSAHERSGKLLVQEYLPGEEYSVDVLAGEDGAVLAAVPRVRLKVDSGVAVAARTVHDADLEAHAAAVARAVGLTGVANVQFRRDARGVARLLEVNARFPGTLPLTIESGVHMPRLALQSVLGTLDLTGPLAFRELGVVRTWQEHYVSVEELAEPPLAGVLPATGDVLAA
jgi:carbamoyl-phosphate synthase large subunit